MGPKRKLKPELHDRKAWITDPRIPPGRRTYLRIYRASQAVIAEKKALERPASSDESFEALAQEIEARLDAGSPDEAVPDAVQDDPVEFAGFGDTMEMSQSSDDEVNFQPDDEQGTDDDEAEQAEPTDRLYPGCDVSSLEASTLIFAFAMRHSLTKAGTTELLTLLKLLLPAEAKVPATIYRLEKTLHVDVQSSVTKCVFCPTCRTSIKTQGDVCEICSSRIDESQLIKDGQFFLMFDVQRSLEKVLELKEVSSNMLENLAVRSEKRRQPGYVSKIPAHYSAIVDGDNYRRLKLEDNDITCTINTDGVNVFNSSSYSIWPLFLSFNELDYKLRRNSTVLAGVWFGMSKPSFQTFFSPFVEQMNTLSKKGLTWNVNGVQLTSRVFFTNVAADSVARAPLQGMKQFNGQYGCPYCFNPGSSCKFVGKDGQVKNKWIYMPCQAEKRSLPVWKEDLKKLQKLLEKSRTSKVPHVNGLLCASPFMALINFDIVDGFLVDYMHTALLGVLKAITTMFLDSKHHKEDFYLGTAGVVKDINARLAKCKIPSEVNRTTRDISECSYWKANEWKTWLLVSIPVLQGILKSPFLEHFAKFILGISLLIGDKITPKDIDSAEQLLLQFNNEAPALYTNYVMTFNMHLITHAPDCVRKWGPLSGYSLFQFEHANGLLTKMFKGTRVVAMQIVRNVIVMQEIRSGSASVTNPSAKLFLESMIDHKMYYSKIFKCANGVTFVGPRKQYTFNDQESSLLTRKYDVNVKEIKEVWSYKHMFLNGKRFGAKDSAKISNSVVKIGKHVHFLRKLLLIVFSDSTHRAICFVNTIVAERSRLQYFKSDLLYHCTSVSGAMKAFPCQHIENVKFIALHNSHGNITHLCQLANSIELE